MTSIFYAIKGKANFNNTFTPSKRFNIKRETYSFLLKIFISKVFIIVMIKRSTFWTNAISVILIFTVISSAYTFSTRTKKENSFETEKEIAVDAESIAQKRLAKNKKDQLALTLVKLAHHLYPDYEKLLLLRGKLKYNLEIDPPHNEGTTETEFVYNLKKRAMELSKNSNIRDRHLCLIYYSIIRLFDPENEKALIQLMKFADQEEEMNIEKLFVKKFSQIPYYALDPKDSRYAVGNVKKTIEVHASEPWTDTWIKVKSGQVIRVTAKRFWTLGSDGTFPYTDADGFDNLSLQELVDKGNKGKKDRSYNSRYRVPKFVTRSLKGKKDMKPGCLLAKIGKTVYPAGRKTEFRAESDGILSFGPFEWDSYSDNSGYLLVTVEVSDH